MFEKDVWLMANEDIVRTITGAETNVMTSEGVDNSLASLARMTEEELIKIKGIGKKKARQIIAAFELGRRLFEEKHTYNDLGSSIALYNHLKPKMAFRNDEEGFIVLMNQNFKEIATIKISDGCWTNCFLDVRKIMKEVFLHNATILAIAHNHPSNSVHPSKDDDAITFKIAKACEIMHIFFMDHVIIGDNGFYSYHDKGRL